VGSKFTYHYDFGDDWQQEIRIDKIGGHAKCGATDFDSLNTRETCFLVVVTLK
jgi:hypothetical protein